MLKNINLQLFAGADNIILGDGVFAIGGVDIALTRGGGRFMVEREYKDQEADGDFGRVKGRIRLIKSQAKLMMRVLEILPAKIPKMYPATSEDTTTSPGTSTITGMDGTIEDIQDTDYQSTVTWTGTTKDGKAVVITLDDAINLQNLDWELLDKGEIVPELTYEGCYDPAKRTTEPWKIDYATA